MVVMVVAAARAFHKARRGGEYTELVDGGFKGAVGSGATMAAVALATSAGGPAGVALLVGLTAGIVANSATKNVSLTAIGRFVATRAAAMTTDPATDEAADPPEADAMKPVPKRRQRQSQPPDGTPGGSRRQPWRTASSIDPAYRSRQPPLEGSWMMPKTPEPSLLRQTAGVTPLGLARRLGHASGDNRPRSAAFAWKEKPRQCATDGRRRTAGRIGHTIAEGERPPCVLRARCQRFVGCFRLAPTGRTVRQLRC